MLRVRFRSLTASAIFLVAAIAFSDFSRPELQCSAASFGLPPILDCLRLLAFLPRGDTRFRHFIEPELSPQPITANWPGFKNDFDVPMTQVPKYWKAGEQMIALVLWRISEMHVQLEPTDDEM